MRYAGPGLEMPSVFSLKKNNSRDRQGGPALAATSLLSLAWSWHGHGNANGPELWVSRPEPGERWTQA
jgi:hypothetical protein